MPTLCIALLGTYAVTLDGRPVTDFGYDKVRGLLAYLAVEADRPHRRDHLATLFWPERDRRGSLQSLSQALYRLRRAFDVPTAAAPVLRITPQTIQFNLDCDHWIDTQEFTNLLDICHAHRHTLQVTCPECLARLQQAAALVHGNFLEGFSLRDSPEFDEWVLFQRERLRHLAIQALSTLANGHERRGDSTQALVFAQRWLAIDPWQEDAHCHVMRALAASGQRSAALVQFETCRRILAAELGVEPAPATVALCERIRAGSDGDGAFQETRHNLPAPLTPLIGRAHELNTIIQRLHDPDCRLVSLVGPGGSGKTRLAIAAAELVLGDFTDGVILAPLAAIDTAPAIVPALAQAIGLFLARQEDARRQLIDFLRTKKMLLVLDNFEHLLSGAHLLVEILAAAAHVKILVTSRAHLNIVGEQVILVEGLALPSTMAAAGVHHNGLTTDAANAIAASDAVALFLYHARRVCSDYEPTAADLAAIAQICDTVAGIPLAIVLAAVWMDLLSPPAIAHQLLGELAHDDGGGIDLLAADLTDLPERQRSMRTVLDQTWRLLSGQDQGVLAALAVLRGSFTQDAANAVSGATLRQLRTLSEKSWLHRMVEGRYEIHELLRQYAQEKLQQAPATAMLVRSRHSAYFVTALGRWASELRGERQLAALVEEEADLENVQAAWNWAVAQADLESVDQAMDGLFLYLDWRGRCQQGEEMCRNAVNQLHKYTTGDKEIVVARLLAWHGWFSQALDHLDVAAAQLHESLALLDNSVPDAQAGRNARAFALYALGHARHGTDRSAARRCWEESLAIYRDLGCQWGAAQVLSRLGLLALEMGDYPTARHLLEESVAICQRLADRKSMAYALCYLGNVYANQGDLTTAEELVRSSIAMSHALGDRLGAAESMGTIAGALAYGGHFVESAALFSQSAAIYEELGIRHAYAYAIHNLAWTNVNLGSYELARQQYLAAQAVWMERNHRHGLALSLLGLGEIALVFEDFDQAYTLLAEGVARFVEIQQQDEQAIALGSLACALRGLGRGAEARCCVRQALQIAQEIGAFAPTLFALEAYALILASEGKAVRALELCTLIRQHPYLKRSHWRQANYDCYISPLADELPAAERAATIARGQQREVHATAAAILAELNLKSAVEEMAGATQ